MSPRGGKREGAGRKPLLGDRVRATFDLERADLERLREVAERRGVSVNALVREAVGRFLKRQRSG